MAMVQDKKKEKMDIRMYEHTEWGGGMETTVSFSPT